MDNNLSICRFCHVFLFAALIFLILNSSPYACVPDTAEKESECYFQEGYKLINDGRFHEAIEFFSRALEINPDHIYAHAFRGSAYRELHLYREALDDFNKVLTVDPKFGSAYYCRGYLNEELKNYPEAYIDYSNAIKVEPSSADYYFYRGELSFLMPEKFQEAINDFDKAIALDPY